MKNKDFSLFELITTSIDWRNEFEDDFDKDSLIVRIEFKDEIYYNFSVIDYENCKEDLNSADYFRSDKYKYIDTKILLPYFEDYNFAKIGGEVEGFEIVKGGVLN